MKRVIAVLLLVLTLAAAVCGCGYVEDGNFYYGEHPSEFNGGRTVSGANLRGMEIESADMTTTLTLSFIAGSRNAGMDEAKIDCVPGYTLKATDEPLRLILTLDADYCDYTESSDWYRSGCVCGSFSLLNGGDGTATVVFQLNSEVTAQVAEEGNSLVITLESIPCEKSNRFFVCLNGVSEYGSEFLAGTGLTPTYCDDLSNKTLISKPYDTVKEADVAALALEDELGNLLPEKKPYLKVLSGNGMPAYSTAADAEKAEEKQVIYENGEAKSLHIKTEAGALLCESADGFAYTANDISGESGQHVRLAAAGAEKAAGSYENIKNADFSLSGRYLAVLDETQSGGKLSVFDTQKDKLYKLEQRGVFGEVSSFAWSDETDMLYIIAGTADARVLEIDFSAETPSYAADMGKGYPGNICSHSFLLYMRNTITGRIMRRSLVSGFSSDVCRGSDMRLSAGGRYLAALRGVDAQNGGSALSIVNTSTDKLTVIEEDAEIKDYLFSADGAYLYYTKTAENPENAEYGTEFCRVSCREGTRETLGFLSGGRIVKSAHSGVVYIVERTASGNKYATYIYEDTRI